MNTPGVLLSSCVVAVEAIIVTVGGGSSLIVTVALLWAPISYAPLASVATTLSDVLASSVTSSIGSMSIVAVAAPMGISTDPDRP